jgi:hypothetical protein
MRQTYPHSISLLLSSVACLGTQCFHIYLKSTTIYLIDLRLLRLYFVSNSKLLPNFRYDQYPKSRAVQEVRTHLGLLDPDEERVHSS